ncbi:MAG: glycosyltransferase [Vicinamibacteria bacterium]|nr:glycosyltransferase [Vicinamibacteria bacterium]
MRLLHVTPFYADPAFGGIARASQALCRALAARGHHVTVVTARLAPDLPALADDAGVQVLRLPGPRAAVQARLPWPRGVARVLAGLGAFDVVHLHGARHGLAVPAAACAARCGAPLVVQPHGTHPDHAQRRFAKRVYDVVWGRRVWRAAAAALAVSQAEARDLPRRAEVVPNGVLPLRCTAPAPERVPGRLLFVGNPSVQKRGRALPALLAALPAASLHVVGPVDARFRAAFARFGARVSFDGVLAGEALANAYASAALLVHPAVGEAFGLVPFEAALLGTAGVVAGAHGCGEWYAEAGGACVPADAADALAAAVAARLADPALAAAEAARVAAFVGRHLTWDAAARTVEALYIRLRAGA